MRCSHISSCNQHIPVTREKILKQKNPLQTAETLFSNTEHHITRLNLQSLSCDKPKRKQHLVTTPFLACQLQSSLVTLHITRTVIISLTGHTSLENKSHFHWTRESVVILRRALKLLETPLYSLVKPHIVQNDTITKLDNCCPFNAFPIFHTHIFRSHHFFCTCVKWSANCASYVTDVWQVRRNEWKES